MRAFVTGGTGFIGGRVVRRLRERGDDVVALVRSPGRAGELRDLGCELVEGDLADEEAIRKGVVGCEAAFHVGAVYRVGIPARERPAMYDANVNGTARVLDAAQEAGVSRIVYVSTVGIFGDTRGKVVDETYRREPGDFKTYYEETKYLAHEIALDRIAKGAPIVIVQPGGVYGPGDTSEVADVLNRIRTGKLPFKAMADAGFVFAHVDDVADGIVAAHDRGRIGESYVLGGERASVGDLIDRVAMIGGRRPPRITIPTLLIKAAIPFGPVVGKLMGLPPNLGEMIRASDRVTYWATHDKAARELGYAPRDLDTGLTQTFAEA